MSTATAPQPMDVRLMNVTATLLFAACGVLAVGAVAWWAVRHPVFALARITVTGDVAHSSAATLRANVTPRVAGNFFTVDLRAARQAFLEVPWVREATVRREFPNRLKVVLQEHQPAAFWGAEGDTTLVNSFGEVFEANPGDIDPDQVSLPRLSGPQDQSAQVLALYRQLEPLFEPLELQIDALTLSGRGSWRIQLDSGATVELGRGTNEELLVRARRFVDTVTQVASRYGRKPEAVVAADLRHADGYAIRLRGVSTVPADAQKK